MVYIDVAGYGSGSDGAVAAFTAGGPNQTYVWTGTWVHTRTVTVPGGCRLLGYGAYVTCDDSGLPLFYNYDPAVPQPAGYGGAGDLVVEGFTFDMRGNVNAVIHNAFTVAHAARVTFRNCRFLNLSGYHAIEVHSCRNVLIDNCWFEGYTQSTASFPREAVQLDSVGLDGDDGTANRDVELRHCWTGASDVSGPFGSLVGSHTVGAAVHRGIVVARNTVDACLAEGVNAYCWSDSEIVGNHIDHAGTSGVRVRCATIGGNGATRVKVNDNRITYAGANGVRFADGTARLTNVEAQENMIMYSGSNGILVYDTDRVLVADNQVRSNTANHGIQVGNGSADTVTAAMIEHNQLTDIAEYAIRVNCATKSFIHGNRVIKGTASLGAVNVAGVNTGTSILSNDFSDNGWSAATAMAGSYTGIKTTHAGGSSIPGDNLI